MKRIGFALLTMMYASLMMAQHTFSVQVHNSSKSVRTDEPIVIPLNNYGEVRSALVTVEGKEIPCQLDDLNQDETYDELCFLADLGKKEKKIYHVTLYNEGEPRTYPARVYAEMVMGNSKDKTLKKNQQNNYVESITARGDAAYTYNLLHHHGVDFEVSSMVYVSISTNDKRSISTASTKKGLNCRPPSFIPNLTKRRLAMVTTSCGWAIPLGLEPFVAGTAKSPQ